MPVKLNKIMRELNVGLPTIVDFLQKKGIEVEEGNPNARVSDDIYEVLKKEFGNDQNQKKESELLRLRHKEKSKNEVVTIETVQKEEPEEVKIEVSAPVQFKQVGKIDLDSLNKKPKAKPAEEPVEEEKPVEEEPVIVEEEPIIEEPAVEEPEEEVTMVEEAEEDTPVEEIVEVEEAPVSRPRVENKVNVVGKIDLDSLNQQTRPKKKSKEELRKEREEKYPPKNKHKSNQNSNNAESNSNSDEKKKRNRIQKERIDINKNYDHKQSKGKNNRNNRSFERVQPDEEEVQRQVKETLALLTNKVKSKGAKYRKDKREAASLRMQEEAEQERIDSETIKITEFVTVNELATMMDVPVTKVIGTCMSLGLMVSINQRLDAETINIVADEFGFKTEYVSVEVSEKINEVEDKPEDLVPRAPIVTVMGHVDHGKTSLLDYIRKANVIAGEAGGITQHIGAYQVTLDGKVITFLDTPGHAAFTAMRARGAQATDIAVLVVAADDGIMPQTIEAINHAKAADVPIIVAINKIDKPEANIERIKTQLTEHGLLPEEWGGDTILCPVSAKTGQGVEDLLANINLVAEVKELKANPKRKAKGIVIEAKLDQNRGPIATVIIQNGTLRVADSVIVGTVTGKIRAMNDDKNRKVASAGPSFPVSIMGLDEVPNTGDILYAVEQEKLVKMVAEERKNKERENMIKASQKVTLDDVFNKIAEGEMKVLNIIVKADVQGSVEAVKQSLEKLSNEQVRVNVIHAAVGAIKESDIMLAESSRAIIIGFNVRPDANSKAIAEKSGIDIKLYRVIYEAIEDVERALKGMLAPKFNEIYLGKAEVREVFKISGVGQVAGCYVTEGKIIRSGKLRIYRDDVMICEGNVLQLKRFKDDVKEVSYGFECGISIEKFNDIKVGDFIESYQVEETR